MTKNSEEI